MGPKIWEISSSSRLFPGAGSLWTHTRQQPYSTYRKKITVTNKLTKVDWVIPHIAVLMEAKGYGADTWKPESNSPSCLVEGASAAATPRKAIFQHKTSLEPVGPSAAEAQ